VARTAGAALALALLLSLGCGESTRDCFGPGVRVTEPTGLPTWETGEAEISLAGVVELVPGEDRFPTSVLVVNNTTAALEQADVSSTDENCELAWSTLEPIALVSGENLISISAVMPGGTASAQITVTRN
jgi:hypothetical protein